MIEGGSVRNALAEATEVLNRAGIDTAALDAAQLLADVLDTPFLKLGLAPDLNDDQADEYDQLVRVRARRIPLQHIAGGAHFHGNGFAVGPGVFVPRPETEILAEWALEWLSGQDEYPRVVDLCAGSGAVALTIGAARDDAIIDAVENDADSFVWLRRNQRRIAPHVRLVFGDAADLYLDIEPGVDLVTCNPPYVPAATEVSDEVRHDPSGSVFAGEDGLELIRPLIRQTARLLRPGGAAIFEHDETHQDEVAALFTKAGFVDVERHQDLAGRPRFVSAVCGSRGILW